MAEKKKTTGSAGKKDSGARKPAGGKPAPKKPSAAGGKGGASAPAGPSGKKPAGKPTSKPSSSKDKRPAGPKPAGKPAPKKPSGAGGKPSGGGAKPSGSRKDERSPGSKPAGGKPAPRKPSGAGKSGDGAAWTRPEGDRPRDGGDRPPTRKPAGGKPAPRKPSGAGGKPSGSGGRPTGSGAKPSGAKRDERPSGSKPAAKSGPRKPATGGKKGEGPARGRAGDRKRPSWDKPEPRSAKPRKPAPRTGDGAAPKRLPKEAVLAGVQPQLKTIKRPGAKKATRPDPASVRATMLRVAGWLHAKKALDIVALDVSGLCSVAEGQVLATARNVRQAQALADHVLKSAGEVGISYLGMEGYRTGTWVLVDLNDVLVHVFQEDSRRFYNLEGLWADAASLELELGPGATGAEDDDA
jgi:ribosome-associated protein